MKSVIVVLSLVLVSSFGFAKGDAAKGKAKSVTCAACHGAKGISMNPAWPNLAGQKDMYLIKQLKDFKSGKRRDPSMAPMVMSLTDKDMENLAAYYSGL